MSKSKTPIWQPLEKLSLFASLIDEQVEACQKQLENLDPTDGRKSPVLDDALVQRMFRVYREQQKNVPLFAEQLSRWQNEKPSEAQRSEIKRLEQQLDCWKKALEELLSLAREYQEFTIEKVLARDDVKVAFDVITGKMRRWLKGPLLL